MKLSIIPAVTLLTLCAGPVYAACSYPKAPANLPDGGTATKEQMLEGKATVTQYNTDIEAYLTCLKTDYDTALTTDGATLTDDQKKERETRYNQMHNAAVDELEAVAARFNEQVKVFKAKEAESKSKSASN
jgi:hypothetical protein